ncbi:MAG: ROK family protein [Deltaproteobacteria bacterium]
MQIGIDFGGTRVKAGLVDGDRVVRRASAATKKDREYLLGLVPRLVAKVDPDREATALGIGFAGMVGDGRILHTTDTMPPLTDFPLASFASEATGLPCAVDNDGNAHALAEGTFGVGAGASLFVMLVLGTGVGGGIVCNGRLWLGAGSMASHLGHIKVRRGGRRCACGARGCIEAYAAAYAIGRGGPAKPVFAAARAGEEAAVRTVAEAADAIGAACANLTNILNPDVIAIGGGMTRAWSQLWPGISAAYARDALAMGRASSPVVRARLGNDAGLVGAALLGAHSG